MGDGLEVKNPQGGFEYRWIRNNELNIIKSEAEGYEVCKGEDKQSEGDLILARISQKLAEAKRMWDKVKPEVMQAAAEENLIKAAKSLGYTLERF